MMAARAARTPMMMTILLGLFVGLLVGLMGVGGGVVLVPALVHLAGMGQHMSQGTSLMVQLPPVGLGALYLYWRRGQVDLRAGLVCALGFLLGGYFGSRAALAIDARDLHAMFGIFLMFAAVLLIRQQSPPPAADAAESSLAPPAARGEKP